MKLLYFLGNSAVPFVSFAALLPVGQLPLKMYLSSTKQKDYILRVSLLT